MKIKSITVFIICPSICHEVMGPDAMILAFCMLSFIFFSFIFISRRLTTLQYCSAFCHTLTWISHGFTCIPHPDSPSHLPLYPIPLSFKPAFSLCSFSLIKRLFISSLISTIRIVSSAYLRLLIFLPAILIPACDSSSPAFHICALHVSYINRVTICNLDVLLSQFWTSLLFHVQFQLLLLDLHTGFSGDS